MTGSTPFTIQDHQYNFMREKHHSPAAALSLLGQSQVYWLLSQSMLADYDVTSLPIHSFRAVEESGIDRRAVSKTKKGGSERRRRGGGIGYSKWNENFQWMLIWMQDVPNKTWKLIIWKPLPVWYKEYGKERTAVGARVYTGLLI